jgi:hypothetical protein
MNDTTEFRCPFPNCRHPYQHKASLKLHIESRHASPDEHHPKGDPLFAHSLAKLKRHKFTHEEKLQRKKETSKKTSEKRRLKKLARYS